jgi:hypothetical protein
MPQARQIDRSQQPHADKAGYSLSLLFGQLKDTQADGTGFPHEETTN